jgi:TolA-binding protein
LTTRYRVTVKGTIFLVRERAPDDVEVSVSRGRVEVAGAGGVWSVVAGQLWSSRHPLEYGVDTITDGQRALLDQVVQPGHRTPIEMAPPELASASPVASAEATARSEEAPAATPAAPKRAARAPKLLARLDPPPQPPAPAPPAPAAGAPPPRSPLEQALDLVRNHRYPEAERTLEALSSGGGSGADIALYELANLRQRHLGDSEGALAALQRYRTTYPEGALRQEAEISIIELELARPDPGGALSHIEQFLSMYPDSERAPEVFWLRAVCQQQLGQTDAAAGTLRAYLKRFPSASHAADAQRALGER